MSTPTSTAYISVKDFESLAFDLEAQVQQLDSLRADLLASGFDAEELAAAEKRAKDRADEQLRWVDEFIRVGSDPQPLSRT